MLPILSLLALAPLVSPAAEGTPESSWLALDAELSALVAEPAGAASGLQLGGHLKSSYGYDDSYVPAPSGGGDTKALNPDFGGFELDSVRLEFGGSVEEFEVKVSLDVQTGTAALVDAYVRWDADPALLVTLGRFKQPLLQSQLVDRARLLFVDRTANADNIERQSGLTLSGTFAESRGTWSASIANGADGVSKESEYIGRLTYDVIGTGAFGSYEGGVVAEEGTHASIGLALADDKDNLLGGRRTAAEFGLTTNGLSVYADLVEHDNDYGGFDSTTGLSLADTTPNSITLSYMAREDIELAWRYENFQDSANTRRRTLGLNFYQILPHRAKWTLSYEDTGSEDINVEQRIFRVALTLAL